MVALMVSSLPQTVPMPGSDLPGIDESLDEIRQKEDVGIQRKNPGSLREIDRLILRGRKADVLGVVNDPAGSSNCSRMSTVPSVEALSMMMISFRVVLLLQDGFEASFDEPATVVRHDRDGYVVVMGHAVFYLDCFDCSNCSFTGWLFHRGTAPAFTLTQALPGQPNYFTIYRYRFRDTGLQHPGNRPREARQHHSRHTQRHSVGPPTCASTRTLADYHTRITDESPQGNFEASAPPHVGRSTSGKKTIFRYPHRAAAYKNQHPQTRSGRNSRRSRPERPRHFDEPSETLPPVARRRHRDSGDAVLGTGD